MAQNSEDQDFLLFRERGSNEALARVFDKLAPRLLLIAGHLARDAAQADDLVQTTFLQAIRDAAHYDGRQSVAGWLAGILKHRALDLVRKQGRQATETWEDMPDDRHDPANLIANQDTYDRLVQTVEGLEQPYREVLLMYLVHGIEARSIAHTLGRSPSTVRMQLKRGLEKLRLALPSYANALALLPLDLSTGLVTIRQAVLHTAKQACPAQGSSTSLLQSSPFEIPIRLTPWKLTGALSMASKLVAVAATLATIIGVTLHFTNSRAEHVVPSTMAKSVSLREGEPDSQTLHSAPLSEPEAAPRKAIVSNPPTRDPVETRPPGLWLVGNLEGQMDERLAELVVLRTPGSENPIACRMLIGERFEIEISELIDDADAHDSLHLEVEHPGHMPFDVQVQLDPRLVKEWTAQKRTEIDVALRLTPALATLRGSVLVGTNTPLSDVRIALVDPSQRQHVTINPIPLDAEGRFTLRAPEMTGHVIVAWNDGAQKMLTRPVTYPVNLKRGGEHMLAPFHLDEGLTISGNLIRGPGEPPAQTVYARIDDEQGAVHRLGQTTLYWTGSTFEHSRVSTRSNDEGEFVLSALGPYTYELTHEAESMRMQDDLPPVHSLTTIRSAATFRGVRAVAPAMGIELGGYLLYAGFQIFTDDVPYAETKCYASWEYDGGSSSQPLHADNKGRIFFSLPASGSVNAWVAFSGNGWATEVVHINEKTAGADELQRIDLVSHPEPVAVTIELDLWADGSAGMGIVVLRPWPVGTARPDADHLNALESLSEITLIGRDKDGSFFLPKVVPGRYWCMMSPAIGNGKNGALPWIENSFELEVPYGADKTVQRTLRAGSRLRIRSEETSHLDNLRFDLRDAEDKRIFKSWGAADGGARQVTEPLVPGRYTLQVTDEALKQWNFEFELIDEEVHEVVLDKEE